MPYETIRPAQLKAMVERLRNAIYDPIAELDVTAWVTPEPVPYAERMSGAPLELAPGDRWGKLWDCAWFRFAGRVPASGRGAKIVLLLDVNGELCIVDEEGSPVQGLTNVNSEFDLTLGLPGKRVVEISDASTGEEEIELWADAGCNDLFGMYRSGTLKEASIAICREDIRQLFYDAEVLLETADRLPEGSARRARIYQALQEASRLLTALNPGRVDRARRLLGEQLAKRGGDAMLTISAVGHAHIDLAWLWPIRETIRKGARTFSTALRMMERYPDYVFGASQPQLYDWIKKRYPKLYARVKERVREGRWEPQGAMWVEPDTNVTGGESLVRQIVYGKRYFRQEFGVDIRTLWMPDVFGYTASLPQILKKSGVDYMMTQKLSWNAYNRHPHHTFMWEGIDGSQILTHMPPEDTYNSPAAPRSIAKAENDYLDKNVSEHCLMLFGIGDGGGGPGEEHLERLSREKNLLGLAPVVQEPSWQFFEKLAEGTERYQTWRGELYLEKHQGTLTSQARNKRFNRIIEKALRELEFAAALAALESGVAYPREELEEIWKEVLLYQFHDILPGSSIKRVYDESLERYALLLERVERMIAESYSELARLMPAAGGAAESTAVFNSLPWERVEWMKADGEWRRVQVPPMGYAVVPGRCEPWNPTPALAETAAFAGESRSSAKGRLLENDVLRLVFGEDGTLTSIYDKVNGREAIAQGQKANVLVIYHDAGDAWDFRQDYRASGGEQMELVGIGELADGPVVGLRMQYKYGRSTLTQEVRLTQGSPRIDFATAADWKESGRMLRTSFPVNVRSDSVSCEIQFGFLRRPTHRNTTWDYAKDEICAHHWIDLSEPDYGVALLNDCKYGHRVENHVMDLNLLRSPSHPDPEADRAVHVFTYALYPHPGDHVQAEIYKRGYELNVPVRTAAVQPSGTNDHDREPLPREYAFLQTNRPNVMVETVKQAEDGSELVVRLYETSGARTETAELKFGFDLESAWTADLMETALERLDPEADGSLRLPLAPFEIKTLRLLLKRKE